MSSNLMDSPADKLIQQWGFGSSSTDQLFKHASDVLILKGRRVGEIVVGLGLSDTDTVESLMAVKPTGVKTLEFLSANIRNLSRSIDHILTIKSLKPYLSRTVPNMVIHPLIGKIDSSASLREEMNRYDMVVVTCDGKAMMVFNDFEKMINFHSLGKSERMKSTIYTTFADDYSQRPERVEFNCAVAESSLYMTLQRELTDTEKGSGSGTDDALQSISHSEGSKDAIVNKIIQILNLALEKEVNDVAIVPGEKAGYGDVQFRLDQRLTSTGILLAPAEKEAVVRVLMARSKANPSGGRLRHPVDGNINFEGKTGQAFLRMSFIPLEESQLPVTSVSMRILPKTAKSVNLKSLGISNDIIKELNYYARRKQGMFVVCGPTGSGKSTTIAGMICSHYDEYGDSLKRVSVEQPCERLLPGVLHIDVSQHHYAANEKPEGSDNFSMALRAILRHDPDLVFVGEVRDKESCVVSIDAANTGHLVLTTTHANDPVLGYRRMASFLDKERRFDLVNTLQGILAQRLIPKLCASCSTEAPITDVELDRLRPYMQTQGLNLSSIKLPVHHRIQTKEGCDHCNGHGIKGMIAIHGLLTMNPKVRELLLSSRESDWMKAQEASDSKVTLFASALECFSKGLIDLETLML